MIGTSIIAEVHKVNLKRTFLPSGGLDLYFEERDAAKTQFYDMGYNRHGHPAE